MVSFGNVGLKFTGLTFGYMVFFVSGYMLYKQPSFTDSMLCLINMILSIPWTFGIINNSPNYMALNLIWMKLLFLCSLIMSIIFGCVDIIYAIRAVVKISNYEYFGDDFDVEHPSQWLINLGKAHINWLKLTSVAVLLWFVVSIMHALYKSIDKSVRQTNTSYATNTQLNKKLLLKLLTKIKSTGQLIVEPFDGCYIKSLNFLCKFGKFFCKIIEHYSCTCKKPSNRTQGANANENLISEQNSSAMSCNVTIETSIKKKETTTNTEITKENSDTKSENDVDTNSCMFQNSIDENTLVNGDVTLNQTDHVSLHANYDMKSDEPDYFIEVNSSDASINLKFDDKEAQAQAERKNENSEDNIHTDSEMTIVENIDVK